MGGEKEISEYAGTAQRSSLRQRLSFSTDELPTSGLMTSIIP
jgi:hypothetical protein